MLVCDLPCDVCEDVTLVKFVKLRLTHSDEATTASIEIYCQEHNAGHADTVLLRECAD